MEKFDETAKYDWRIELCGEIGSGGYLVFTDTSRKAHEVFNELKHDFEFYRAKLYCDGEYVAG